MIMAENRALLIATIAHIRDLEEHQKQRRNEVDDLGDEQEQHREMKESEILYLVQEKENFNKKVEAKKEKIAKDLADIDGKIKYLVEYLKALNQNMDIESVIGQAEDIEERKPQGLRTVV